MASAIQPDKYPSHIAPTGYAAHASSQKATSAGGNHLPVDFFDDNGSVVGAHKTPITPTVKPSRAAFARKWLGRGAFGAVGAGLLAFAGYGMFAAGPHIAAGVTTALAVPAVHFIGIGVGVTLAVVAVGFGVYLGVKAFNNWRNNRAHTPDRPNVLTKGPPALNVGNRFDDGLSFVDNSEAGDTAAWVDRNAFPSTTPADALPPPAISKPKTAPRGPTRFADVASAPSTSKTRAPKENFENLGKDGSMSEADIKSHKDFYAYNVVKYHNATLGSEKSRIFAGLSTYADKFPELKDEETFAAAVPGLLPTAELWNNRRRS